MPAAGLLEADANCSAMLAHVGCSNASTCHACSRDGREFLPALEQGFLHVFLEREPERAIRPAWRYFFAPSRSSLQKAQYKSMRFSGSSQK